MCTDLRDLLQDRYIFKENLWVFFGRVGYEYEIWHPRKTLTVSMQGKLYHKISGKCESCKHSKISNID